MIEVIPAGDGWTWRLIDAEARVLVFAQEHYATDFEAQCAAVAYRSAFWQRACTIDHRMGACI